MRNYFEDDGVRAKVIAWRRDVLAPSVHFSFLDGHEQLFVENARVCEVTSIRASKRYIGRDCLIMSTPIVENQSVALLANSSATEAVMIAGFAHERIAIYALSIETTKNKDN